MTLGLAPAAAAAALLIASAAHADPARPATADDRIELGVLGGIHVFSEDNELGTVDVADAPSLKSALTFGVRLGFAVTSLLALEGEIVAVPTKVRGERVDVVNTGWRAAAVLHLGSGRLRPFVLAGAGGSASQSSEPAILDNDIDLVGLLGVGAKLRGGDDWGIRIDARSVLPPSSTGSGPAIDWEATLAVYRSFGAQGSASATAAGPADADGDRIADSADRCPDRAEDRDGFRDGDGCPEDDNDADHIADAADRCPNEPENVNSVADDDGCPDQEPDPDGDGVAGASDRCEDQPEDKDGFQDEDGCPELDNDGDGVADATDRCPDELESPNGVADEDGCPDAPPEGPAPVPLKTPGR
jgi:hypothetical protein